MSPTMLQAPAQVMRADLVPGAWTDFRDDKGLPRLGRVESTGKVIVLHVNNDEQWAVPFIHPLHRSHALPNDWRLDVDSNGGDGLAWTLFSADGKSTASLARALDDGHVVDDRDRETRIPKRVLNALDDLSVKLAEADLW